MKKYMLNRGGDRQLVFQGEVLGRGESGSGGNSGYSSDWNRGVRVRIYKTEGGKYILRHHYWTHWQNEDDRYEASILSTPATLLEALRDDVWGGIREAELEAWEEACKIDPALAAICAEYVE